MGVFYSGKAFSGEKARFDIGSTIQTGFAFFSEESVARRNSFFLSHARVYLEGYGIDGLLKLSLSADAMSTSMPLGKAGTPGSEMYNPESSVPLLLDAKVSWFVDPMNLRLDVGRFIPSYGLLMHHRVSDLGAFAYPLYLHGHEDSLGFFWMLGIEGTMSLTDWMSFVAGIYNGGKNSWLDNNDAKNFMVGLSFIPMPTFLINVSMLLGLDKKKQGEDYVDESKAMPIIEARYRNFGVDIMLGGIFSYNVVQDEGVRQKDFSLGFFSHTGVMVAGNWLEIMLRFEAFNPTTDNSDNNQVRFTAGPQFYLGEMNTVLRVNYILDKYNSDVAMCRNYLGRPECFESAIQIPANATKISNIVYIVLSVDI